MKHPIPAKQDTQIAARSMGYFLETGLRAQFDSAAQIALIPGYDELQKVAERKLLNDYKLESPEAAVRTLLRFHKSVMEQMEQSAKPELKIRLSASKVHHFYSLVYDLLDPGRFEPYRNAIKTSLAALKLPPPLTKVELTPYMAELLATSSPAFEPKRQR